MAFASPLGGQAHPAGAHVLADGVGGDKQRRIVAVVGEQVGGGLSTGVISSSSETGRPSSRTRSVPRGTSLPL
jgi:hypothetical protein